MNRIQDKIIKINSAIYAIDYQQFIKLYNKLYANGLNLWLNSKIFLIFNII
jgi:hypothetical protein